jgi:hypothetical protein
LHRDSKSTRGIKKRKVSHMKEEHGPLQFPSIHAPGGVHISLVI